MLLLSPSLAKRSFVSTQLHRKDVDSRAMIVSSVAVVGFPSDDDESAAPASSVGRGDWDWDEFIIIMIAEASETHVARAASDCSAG